MATVIGALRYDIIADTSKFTSGMALSRKELAAGKKIMEATATKTELYGKRAAELDRLLKHGAITQKAYARAMKEIAPAAEKGASALTKMSTATKLLVAGAATFATTKIVRGLQSAVRSNEEFQQSMASSLAIAGDVSDGMRDRLTKSAQQIAFNTKFSSAEAAGAIQYLQLAGLSLEQTLATMPQVAKFAQAGMFDIATATDLATDAQASMGLTAQDTAKHLAGMARVTDVLVKASTIANATTEQFAAAITSGAGPAARQIGMDIEEATAVLAAFASTGFAKGEEAGTQFGIVMRDLQTKAITNAKAFKDVGISVFDAQGEMLKMSNIIGQLERKFGGLSDEGKKVALMQLGFSDKSVKSTQALMGQSQAIADYEARLRSAAGTTKEVAAKQMPAMTAAIQKLKSTWDVLVETAVNPIVLDVTSKGENSMSTIAEGMASILDATNNIRKAWGYLDIGIQIAAMSIKRSMMVTTTAMQTLVGAIPSFARDRMGLSGDVMAAAASAFDIDKDSDRLMETIAAQKKLVESPSAADRFRQRMLEISKPMDNASPGGGASELEAAAAEIAKGAFDAIERKRPEEMKMQDELLQVQRSILDAVRNMGLVELVR